MNPEKPPLCPPVQVQRLVRRALLYSARSTASGKYRRKLSPIDLEARTRYAAYGRARDAMIKATHTRRAPWTIVDFNDQRRGRLNLIRHLLDSVPDCTLQAGTFTLPALHGQPLKERYKGGVKPIRGPY